LQVREQRADTARVGDPLWTVQAYRISLYAIDCHTLDRRALGPTREAIAWYNTLNIELGEVVQERQDSLIQIRRLLLTMLKRARPDGPVRSMRDLPNRTPDCDN
jgi:hypothetical protein